MFFGVPSQTTSQISVGTLPMGTSEHTRRPSSPSETTGMLELKAFPSVTIDHMKSAASALITKARLCRATWMMKWMREKTV